MSSEAELDLIEFLSFEVRCEWADDDGCDQAAQWLRRLIHCADGEDCDTSFICNDHRIVMEQFRRRIEIEGKTFSCAAHLVPIHMSFIPIHPGGA